MAEAVVWRKGPWTPQEDRLLIDYITHYGEGRWSSVFKCTGLKRSGKSCRLRWVNYLRPGLKKGQLTPQEEGIIIELHALWGNKWSTIARYLPGRTDNEIKNYWRTHFKSRKPSSFKQGKSKILKQQQEPETVGNSYTESPQYSSSREDNEVAFSSIVNNEFWSVSANDFIPTDCYLWGGLWNLDAVDLPSTCSDFPATAAAAAQDQAIIGANYYHAFEDDTCRVVQSSAEFLF